MKFIGQKEKILTSFRTFHFRYNKTTEETNKMMNIMTPITMPAIDSLFKPLDFFFTVKHRIIVLIAKNISKLF